MDCCGHSHGGVTHPWMGRTTLASIGAMLAGGAAPPGSTEAARIAETTADALAVLRNFISVDAHSHGGRTGIISKASPSGDLADAMRAGSLAVACLADVPDWPVLGRRRLRQAPHRLEQRRCADARQHHPSVAHPQPLDREGAQFAVYDRSVASPECPNLAGSVRLDPFAPKAADRLCKNLLSSAT